MYTYFLINLIKVSRADIEWYTGEGELPPYCEMTLRAAGVKEQRGDLHFPAILKGTETSSIVIQRKYEPSQPSTSANSYIIAHSEPQSLTNPQLHVSLTKSTTAGNSKIEVLIRASRLNLVTSVYISVTNISIKVHFV